MGDVARYSAKETLRDGRAVTIRALRPDDLEAWRKALSRSSQESLHHRFFDFKRGLTEKEEHYFLDIDFINHVALVAVADENGKSIVGVGRYVIIGPGKAEIAFLVIDEYQAKGIGSLLMRHLAALARAAGVTELTAEVLSDNKPMIKVFSRSGLQFSAKHEGAIVHVTMRFQAATDGPGSLVGV
jgi:RimJ/RimL family protein N-acetyltransferase